MDLRLTAVTRYINKGERRKEGGGRCERENHPFRMFVFRVREAASERYGYLVMGEGRLR